MIYNLVKGKPISSISRDDALRSSMNMTDTPKSSSSSLSKSTSATYLSSDQYIDRLYDFSTEKFS